MSHEANQEHSRERTESEMYRHRAQAAQRAWQSAVAWRQLKGLSSRYAPLVPVWQCDGPSRVTPQ